MADPSDFWKMVDRTKPSKLRVFAVSELRDCEDYFLEIQSDSTLPPNEIITASERLTLLRSEIDLRHNDARHEQTQRLARWAIGVGIVGMSSAVVAIVFAIANRPTPQHVPAAATQATQTAAVSPPTPAALPTSTPATLLTTTLVPAASPTMSVVSTRTRTTPQKKTRRTRRKRPTPTPPSFWDRLFKPKSTPPGR
jgi:cytoskeletal protein RodZ